MVKYDCHYDCCDGKDVRPTPFIDEGTGLTDYYMFCNSCNSCGPVAIDKIEAFQKWASRSYPVTKTLGGLNDCKPM